MPNTIERPPFDLLGIGIGPFNMSIAALLQKVPQLHYAFVEQKPSFSWHPNMLLPQAKLQVSYLKDLVSLVDPTNSMSFINYLNRKQRLYRFLTVGFDAIYREEFATYLTWASEQIPGLYFNQGIREIEFDGTYFISHTDNNSWRSKHLVLGTGQKPHVPEFAVPHYGNTVFHNSEFLARKHHFAGKRVCIIGGGQSGAEIFQQMIQDQNQLPSELTWVASRPLFQPMDNSPFANELFTPGYAQHFYQLNQEQKDALVSKQTLASDGISDYLLNDIYRQLYYIQAVLNKQEKIRLLPNTRAIDLQQQGHWQLTLQQQETREAIAADIIILCTGYRQQIPVVLDSLQKRLHLDNGRYQVNDDYSINWDGPNNNRIYVHNAARHSHGVNDPNLSLMAYRSATIINSILGKDFYNTQDQSHIVDWSLTNNTQPMEVFDACSGF